MVAGLYVFVRVLIPMLRSAHLDCLASVRVGRLTAAASALTTMMPQRRHLRRKREPWSH